MTVYGTAATGRDARPVLVCLHWLGGSSRSWDALAAALEPDMRIVTVDLPGFGDAAHRTGLPVAAMASHVVDVVRAVQPDRWVLAGHSMGGKVALAVARKAEDGVAGLAGLSHLILLAGSPPAPEPMEDARRETMLGWFRSHPAQSRIEAQTLIDGNVGSPLAPDTNERVAVDILRLNRDAWVAWLENGSREDWVDRIGVLTTPALVIAGERDGDLGPEGQKRLMVRHFADVTFATIADAGHLLPLERPAEVATLIRTHVGSMGASTIPPAYRAFIDSDRVSERVRALLLERGAPDDPNRTSKVMSAAQMSVLRALADRVLPQPEPRIDIAARIDEGLGTTPGDGWRFSDLPADQDSYRHGLDTLQALARAAFGQNFEAAAPDEQDALLATLAQGQGSPEPAVSDQRLGPHQMALWFEDVRANIVRVYMSHPLAMARIGYSGIGYGGDGERLQGFTTVGLGQTEPWEPAATEAGR